MLQVSRQQVQFNTSQILLISFKCTRRLNPGLVEGCGIGGDGTQCILSGEGVTPSRDLGLCQPYFIDPLPWVDVTQFLQKLKRFKVVPSLFQECRSAIQILEWLANRYR